MIDILIPLYNTNIKLLKRCLSSISSQTIVDDLKVTILDDYSGIDYSEIINSFSHCMKIDYIKSDINRGVGATRKLLYSSTSNEYVMWVDSDDCFADCMVCERFLHRIKQKQDTQLVVGGYYQCFDNLKVNYVGYNVTWLFSKLYKRSELDRFNIDFCDLRCNEDAYYNGCVFAAFDKIEFIDEPMYLWQNNEFSLTRNKNHDFYMDQVKYVDSYIMLENWKRKNSIFTDFGRYQTYDGLILFYREYCKLAVTHEEKCEDFLSHVSKYYKLVVSDINEFANSKDFLDRVKLIMRDYDWTYIPIITLWDWLWKLAKMNGEF